MTSEVKLVDMIDTINGMNDVDSVKSYCLSVISTLQKELQKTKFRVEDFRNSHGIDSNNLNSRVIHINTDPVINGVILHLRKKLLNLSGQVEYYKQALDAREYTHESKMGQHLISKVHSLQVENDELSQMLFESQVQPFEFELSNEKEMNKALDKKLKALHQLNAQLKKDNDYLAKKVSDLRSKKSSETALKKSHKDSYSKRSSSGGRRSSSARRSTSPKRRERTHSPRHSRQIGPLDVEVPLNVRGAGIAPPGQDTELLFHVLLTQFYSPACPNVMNLFSYIFIVFGVKFSISLAPLLEVNRPPYSLVNVNLERDSHVDSVSELSSNEKNSRKIEFMTRMQFRRENSDSKFLKLDKDQHQNYMSTPHTLPTPIFAPVGLCDDSRNVNKALKSIRKQLGPPRRLDNGPYKDSSKDTPETSSPYTSKGDGDSAGSSAIIYDGNSACASSSTIANHSSVPNTDLTAQGANTSDSALRFQINSRNRYHKSLWIAMKKRDSLSFDRTCQQLRNSGLGLDAVSYTLMINGTLMFSKSSDMDQALGMVEEMKEAGIHPCFIRFLSVSAYSIY
ncbi:hypothetical protein MACJ_000494 [Theileria orientalis]|uniref:Uncharacterized protein n=1 Tax=Theileria orientalis TaxID=68886 RepID=A0A976QPU1_THEOR|nr:hypothetical protein MACJ_000494 [Theileria orientalis]